MFENNLSLVIVLAYIICFQFISKYQTTLFNYNMANLLILTDTIEVLAV